MPTHVHSFRTIRELGCPYTTNNHDGKKAKEKEKFDNPQSTAHLTNVDINGLKQCSDEKLVTRVFLLFPDHGGSALSSNHIDPNFKLM